MPDYSGYFLKGLAGGVSTGLNMGQQIQEMQWQKKQRKILEEKQKKMVEVGNLFSAKVKEFAPGGFSDEETNKISTIFLSGGYEFMEHYQNAMKYITDINDKKLKEELEYLDLFIGMTEGLEPNAISGIYDDFEKRFTSEKASNYFKANKVIQEKKYKEAEEERDITIGKALPEEYRYPYFEEKGLVGEITPTPGVPTMADEKSAVAILRIFVGADPKTFESKRTELERRTGLDLRNYTQDVLKEVGSELYNLYDTPEEVMANVTAPAGLIVVPSRDSKTGKYYASFQKKPVTTTPGGYRATSLSTQEDYKQKALDAFTWTDAQSEINTYTEAGYDPTEMPTKQEWINEKLEQLNNHVGMLEEITDEEGRLLGGKKFPFMLDDDKESKTGEAWYRDVYEAYMFYLDELRKMGVDVTRYPKIKAPGEVKKAFWGKYPSIYYTETTPTPTRTPTGIETPIETPKLPSL